jgi:hypothetical protein
MKLSISLTKYLHSSISSTFDLTVICPDSVTMASFVTVLTPSDVMLALT